jgi:uncharacterized OsmC-like protein
VQKVSRFSHHSTDPEIQKIMNAPMKREALKSLQAPLKERYQQDPSTAVAQLRAEGTVDFVRIGCSVELPSNNGTQITAGLHPKVGGDGTQACSGDMLLQALVTCAGTTLAAVATSLGLEISEARIEAIGTMDFRGTLGIDRTVPVGFTHIDMIFRLKTNTEASLIEKLLQLTERYCVVFQTLAKGVTIRSQQG